LLILRQDKLSHVPAEMRPSISLRLAVPGYLISFSSILGISILGFLLLPLIGYKSVGFLFLLGILILSFFVGQGPIFLAAILSTFSWDYFFIPPVFELMANFTEDIALILIYFTTAATIGILTNRIHKQDEVLKLRENKLQHLYEIERDIANASNFPYLRLQLSSHLQTILNGQFDLLAKGEGDTPLIFDSQLPILQQEKEQTTALWVLQNGKMAGWSTSTLPSAKGLYLPIKYARATLGVLVYSPNTDRALSIPEMNFLQTVTQQVGIYLERHLFEKRLAHQNYTTQVEKLHVSLLHSISKRFYSPLNQIFTATDQIHSMLMNHKEQQPLQLIEQAAKKLQFMIDNLLAFAELDSGFVKFEKSSQNIREFVENCVKELSPFLEDHPLALSFSDTPFFIQFDVRLMKFAFKNLLLYAIFSSPPKRPIQVEGQKEENAFRLSILCEGPHFEPDLLVHLFDKSYQLSHAKFQNEQLGFAIAKSVMDIHQGRIEVQNREEGRILFSLFIPL
jgi:two-component system sensor histidine kinase KdpD